VSDKIYNFLSVPIRQALSEAQRRELPIEGLTGNERILSLNNLQEGEIGRYVFDRATKLGVSVVSPGTSVQAIVTRDATGNLGLFTDEPIFTNKAIIPKGIRLPVDLEGKDVNEPSADERLIVTTAPEGFTLYVTVSLYAGIALSVPFLLFQIWGFISLTLRRSSRFLRCLSLLVRHSLITFCFHPPSNICSDSVQIFS
jgi:hypothetical protein